MNCCVLDLVKTFYVHLAAGDLDSALGLLAADVDWTSVEGFPNSGSYHGPHPSVTAYSPISPQIGRNSTQCRNGSSRRTRRWWFLDATRARTEEAADG